MAVSDEELLAICRDLDPVPSAFRCMLALRVLTAQGRPPTAAALGEVTGCPRRTVYDALRWLDKRLPDWRVRFACVDPPILARPMPRQRDQLELISVAPTPELWQRAVADRMAMLVGVRSWDLYRDVYSEAADRIIFEASPDVAMGELIALASHLVENLTGRELETQERAMVAMLVRRHGKAALFGINEAIGAATDGKGREWFRYARRVCESAVANIREGQRRGPVEGRG